MREGAADSSGDRSDGLEEALLAIWKETLLDPTVTVESSFWEFGGSSLTAARLATAARRRLGREVSFETLTENPSPHRLAQVIRAGEQP